MKKIFILSLLIMLFMVSSVSAVIYSPMPINGKVMGVNVGGLDIEITNMRTGKIALTKTTDAGEYLVDWSNTDDEGETIIKYMLGDKFRVVIPSCAERPDCVTVLTYMGESEIYTEFDLTRIIIPCPEKTECPVDTCEGVGIEIIIGLLTGIIVFIGGGLKFYKNQAGGATLQHRHKGIRGYHDPNTSHTNIKYKHARWKDNPLKCLMDVKKIEDKGGLI